MIVSTRKIEFYPVDNSDWKKLYDYRFQGVNLLNKVYMRQLIIKEVPKMNYTTDALKRKVMTCAYDDTKDVDIPSAIRSGCSMAAYKACGNDYKDILKGLRSPRHYKYKGAVPVYNKGIILKDKNVKNFCFTFCGIPCKTRLGRDFSGNEMILDRIKTGEYKMCDSSFQIASKNKKTKAFLLLTFKHEQQKIKLDHRRSINVKLSLAHPIEIDYGKGTYNIGDYQEFIHRRIAIRSARIRTQSGLRYNSGGRGRIKKFKPLIKYQEKEKNYVNSMLHIYSRKLINYCVKYNYGKIRLSDEIDQLVDLEEGKRHLIISSWSYFNLKSKIQYKANKVGIEIIGGAVVRPCAEAMMHSAST